LFFANYTFRETHLMANNKSAIKRWHQSLKRRDRNRSTRSAARTAIRNLRETAVLGDEAATRTALSQAYSAVDRAAKKGAIHTGKADRTKRRLAALVARS
jgi:small subunit ribosomal protein S20